MRKDDLSDKRVVLTGATGFLGRSCAERFLKSGWSVLALGRDEGRLTQLRDFLRMRECPLEPLTSACCSLDDKDTLCSLVQSFTPKAFVHAASPVPNSATNFEPIQWLEQMLQHSLHCVEAIQNSSCEIVCLVSSASVYQRQQLNLEEDAPLVNAGNHPYAYGKYLSEEIFRIGCTEDRYRLSILRPCQIYGPGEPHGLFLSQMIEKLRHPEAELTINNKGDDVRHYVHVEDVAEAVVKCIELPANGVFNIADEKAYRMEDIARCAARLSVHDVKVVLEPETRAANEVSYSIERAKKGFQYSPKFSLEDGLAGLLRGEGEL